jgi:hypothetical protein
MKGRMLMKTIWKYELKPECELEMPLGAEILTIQMQFGEDTVPFEHPRLWALVDLGVEKEKRSFCTYGTGHSLPDKPGRYIGTFQLDSGSLVFHVFETTGLS